MLTNGCGDNGSGKETLREVGFRTVVLVTPIPSEGRQWWRLIPDRDSGPGASRWITAGTRDYARHVHPAPVHGLQGSEPPGPPHGKRGEADGVARASLYLHFGGEDG